MTGRQDLVRAYWKYDALFTSKERAQRLQADEWQWAYIEVDEAIDEADDDIFSLLTDLADGAPSDEALNSLGAGPLENLVKRHWRDPKIVDRLDGFAVRNERFRKALCGVWFGDEVPQEIQDRLSRFRH